VAYSLMDLGGEELAVFDLFRLEGGMIVEHWDNMEPIPAGQRTGQQRKVLASVIHRDVSESGCRQTKVPLSCDNEGLRDPRYR